MKPFGATGNEDQISIMPVIKSDVEKIKMQISDIEANISINNLRVSAIKQDLNTAVKLLPGNFHELADGLKGDSETRLLFSANVTRFGVLTLSIYLVQILINLYRFNSKPAAYYRTQADILMLYNPGSNEIGDLLSELNPPLDFGKEPAHLTKLIVDRVGEAATRAFDKLNKKKQSEDNKNI